MFRFLIVMLLFCPLFASEGQIIGKVLTSSGRAPGVKVSLKSLENQTIAQTSTDANGAFRFAAVEAGTYNLEFEEPYLAPHVEEKVLVNENGITEVTVTMTSMNIMMDTLTVASASKEPERIVEAPAAISLITAREMEVQAAQGLLPRVLESTPGVELAQSGVFDFNLSARGFNSSLNRRVLTLIDGRDTATGFLGNQEWSAMTFALDEVESMELLRGPGAALYGANAFNGVLNIKTKRPIDHPGGKVSLSGGELNMRRVDARYAGGFGLGWAYRVTLGGAESESWSLSRTAADRGLDGEFEYAGLGQSEQAPLNGDEVKVAYGSFRLDKDFISGQALTLEIGSATTQNEVAITGIGRVQIDDSRRPFARINFNTPHFNLMASRSIRDTPDGMTFLANGRKLFEDSTQDHFEGQANYELFDGRLTLIGGAAYRRQDIDTADNQGVQTLMAERRIEHQNSFFGQAKWNISEKLDLILADRWDNSSLHDARYSPKAALVYKVDARNSIRATYNEAFQTPNYSEFFLLSPSANQVPFGQLQDAVVLGGFGLNLRPAPGQPIQPGQMDWQTAPVVAIGNPNLVPETVKSYELGYKGILFGDMYLTLDLYKSRLNNFVTDLLATGVNPAVPAFQFAEQIPGVIQNTLLATMQQVFGASALGLSNLGPGIHPYGLNLPDGHPVIVASYTNAGKVDTTGVDFAINYYLNKRWTLDANLSWFDYKIVDPGLAGDSLIPNSSDLKYNLGVSYDYGQIHSSLKYRSVKAFDWAAGVYAGNVPSFETLNLSLEYKVSDRMKALLNVENMLDQEHYQIFGGSLNRRRASASVNFSF